MSGCSDEPAIIIADEVGYRLPSSFNPVSYPQDNEYTAERWDLGKRLFYENRLSIDSTINCGSCHKAELAFSDDVAMSNGVKGRPGTRNSPSLANVAFHPYYTREGGVPTLEQQILVPLQEHNEFAFNILKAGERLSKDSSYDKQSIKAYSRPMDYYVITRAIANFERSLVSTSSKFDAYIQNTISNPLTKQELQGMMLFYSDKTNCYSCHGGPNFTEYSFENNGLYEIYSDAGRMKLTNKLIDQATFKVPSLRNIELTAPYMHDGSLATLAQVVEHYNAGGKPHPNKNKLIRPLKLSEKEKKELLLFLKTLTDQDFVSDLKLRNQ